jgi:hypothetical protein
VNIRYLAVRDLDEDQVPGQRGLGVNSTAVRSIKKAASFDGIGSALRSS